MLDVRSETAAGRCSASAGSAPERRSIVLEEGGLHELREAWRILCRGEHGSAWLDRIGELAARGDRYPAVAQKWGSALIHEMVQVPAHALVASRVLSRVIEDYERYVRVRDIYAVKGTSEAQLRRWQPTASGWLHTTDLAAGDRNAPAPFIRRSTRIATAGSCFARELAQAFEREGYCHFVTEHAPPHLSDEQRRRKYYGGFSARYGLIFNAPSMRQLVERGLGLFEPEPYLFQLASPGCYKDGLWADPYREGVLFDDPEEHEASLPIFRSALRRTLLECEVFVITLGVNEAWYFRSDGSYLSRVPWNLAPVLLDTKILTVEENVEHLQAMLDTWLPYNPALRIIVTVSPVPLQATYRDDAHVIVANAHSKATLLLAAHEFARRNACVTYFPSYETVIYAAEDPFEADGRHVTRRTVSRVMDLFRRRFCVCD